jgi:osmotically-inducible protein OsmY
MKGRTPLIGIVCAYSLALVCGLGGYAPQVDAATQVDARMAESPAAGRSSTGTASALPGVDAANADAANQKLQKRVTAALHANPYLDDEHINVTVERGVVVLRGRVFDDWDLRTALRTARRATGHSPVVDSLSIEQGGR